MADATAAAIERVEPVLFEESAAIAGKRIGFAKLNSEKSLNALSLPMIRLLDARLRQWAADPGIACVVLHGSGEKAFCAGGDVRSLYDAMRRHPRALPNPDALAFFAEEYRLDHFIHQYPKPLLVWGSGIVMGGGLGLFAGASHRVVTETSRFAMPEITIGLFPDVGGSYFLPRMPDRQGLFVALTGASLNGHDVLSAGLATHFVLSTDRQPLFESLADVEWTADPSDNHERLTQLLRPIGAERASARPPSRLEEHRDQIQAMTSADSLAHVYAAITGYDGEDAWLKRAAATLKAGSPTTAALIWDLQTRYGKQTLADTFRTELVVALHCCANADFSEGVRALLVDKDNAPHWSPARLEAIEPSQIDTYFKAPAWPQGRHPLADL